MTKKLLLVTALCTMATGALAQDYTVEGTAQTSSSTFPEPRRPEMQSEYKPDVGVIAGVTAPEGSYDAAGEFGLTANFQPYIPFGIGAELTYTDIEGRAANDDLERTLLLIKGTYNFGGTTPIIRYSYVGVGLGPYFREGGTDLAGAPLAGFDYPIQSERFSQLTVGAAAKYLVVAGDQPDALSVNGLVKFWY